MARVIIGFLFVVGLIGIPVFGLFGIVGLFGRTNAGLDVQTHLYIHREPAPAPVIAQQRQTPPLPNANDQVQLKMLEVLTKMNDRLDHPTTPPVTPTPPPDPPVTIYTIQIQ